jgi:hypothetical protein
MTRSRPFVLPVVLLLGLRAAAGAQPVTAPASRTLPAPVAISKDLYPWGTQMLALPTGEMLVTAAGRVITLDSNLAVKRIVLAPPPGPSGNPPFLSMIRYRGDSIIIKDGTPAMTVLGPTAEGAGRTMAFGRVADIGQLGARTSAPAVDAQGRFLYTTPSWNYVAASARGLYPGTGMVDSVALVAFDQRTRRLDTLARLRSASQVRMVTTVDVATGRSTYASVLFPFVEDDNWGLLSDGTVVIVRQLGCAVDVIPPGGSLQRQPRLLPCRRPDVVPAVRQALVGNIEIAARQYAGAIRGARAEELPDITPAYRGAIADDAGRLWLPIGFGVNIGSTRPDGAPYDVVDRTGTLVDRVVFPTMMELIGFDATNYYVHMRGSAAAGLAPIGRIPR